MINRHPTPKPASRRQWWIHAISVAFIIITVFFCCLLLKAYIDGKFNSVESLQDYISKFGAFGPVVLVLFQALQVIIPVLPGLFGCAAGSILFGASVSFWCNYIGISAGSIIAFFIARKLGASILMDLFPEGKYHKWAHWASKSKSYTTFLFLAMLLPLFPDDFFCYLTGLSKMSAKRFSWIILLGKPWCILAYCLGFALIK